MPAIPVRLSDEEIKKIDALVRLGKFKNRSDAIRNLLQKSLEKESLFLEVLDEEEIAEIESVLDKLLALPKVILDIAPEKTASELVSEGRDR